MKTFRISLHKLKSGSFGLVLLLTLLLAACGGDQPTPNLAPTAVKTAPRLLPTSVSGADTTLTIPTTVVASATTTPRPATTAAPPGPTIAPSDGKFSNDLAYDHVKELAANIGIRPAGSENEIKAADYIESYFRRLGLQASRPEVGYANFVDKGSKLSYQFGANKVELNGNAVNLSGAGNLTAPLAYVGLGMTGQITGGSVRGKIALMQRGQITFREKVENALAEGAVGVIVYNDRAGPLVSVTLEKAFNVPVLGISQQDGERLRQDLDGAGKNSFDVNLSVQAITDIRKVYNVVGVRPAKENALSAPIIIIGGHFDSVPAGPGANDNASGVGIILELARLLMNKYPKHELRFIAFGGEEIGLVGSSTYVQKLSEDELQRIAAMLNIDQVAVGQTLFVGGDPALTKTAFSAAKNEGAGDVQPMPANYANASDHASFAEEGVKVLFLTRDTDPNNHKPGDTADKVRPDLLGLAGNTVIKVIDSLTGN